MIRSRAIPLLVAFLAAGCEGYSVSVTNKEPLEPLPIYEAWWGATEACSGMEGDLHAITWFTALTIRGNDITARGLWTPPHQIILVIGYEDDEITVRHEMLHDLLGGDGDHESPLWERCSLIPD
jgi:hypothetical protein